MNHPSDVDPRPGRSRLARPILEPAPGSLRPVAVSRTSRRARRSCLSLVAAAALLAVPATASAHGGIGVADGGGGGVRIAVQGSAAGPEQVDLATTLTGRGTGTGSKVVYWIRPSGRSRSVRITTQRDESGIHHAEIPVAGRGSWQDWDVSAYVTTSTGKRLRVTNDRADPPGPPEQPVAAPPTGSTTAGAAPTPTEPATTNAVEDVSGEGDSAPGWVIPSVVVLALVGVVAVVLRNRRLPPESDD